MIGGNPIRNVTKAMLEMPAVRGQVWTIAIAHDDGCPAISQQRLDACDCEVVELTAERVA